MTAMQTKDKIKLQSQLFIISFMRVAAFVHLVFGIYFFFIDVPFFVIMSVFDIMVYGVIFFINRSGRLRLSGFLVVLKIASYSVMATFLLGPQFNFQWYILLVALPAIYIDFTNAQRYSILASLPFIANLQFLAPVLLESPPFYIGEALLLEVMNVNFVIVGLLSAIFINIIVSYKVTASLEKDVANFKEIANIDPLTKLNNRRYAESFFEKIENDSCLLCLIDIDNFKNINDVYGHDIGDTVLVAIADILRRNTRQTDLVCRWGGEEFLIGFLKCIPKDGLRVLEEIRSDIENMEMDTEKGKLKVTITAGVSTFYGNDDLKETLEICDKNLYVGKRKGKNIIISTFKYEVAS